MNDTTASTNRLEPGLSAVLIAKDEEAILPLTLPPLIAAADEVVLVDTGSTDRTIEVARDHGCRVHEHPWKADFSEAKNVAISLATHEHILSVDCDEELTLREDLRHFLSAEEPAAPRPAFLVTIQHLVDGGESLSNAAIRLFRTDPRIRFENPVHESVCDSVYKTWPHYSPVLSPVVLQHHGYVPGHNQHKFERNVAILRSWVLKDPDTIFGCYKLGTNLKYLKDPEALRWLDRAFSLVQRVECPGSYPFVPRLVAALSSELEDHGRRAEAQAVRSIGRGFLVQQGVS